MCWLYYCCYYYYPWPNPELSACSKPRPKGWCPGQVGEVCNSLWVSLKVCCHQLQFLFGDLKKFVVFRVSIGKIPAPGQG